MSRNKLMHPRNVLNKPPDYTQLAIKYPDFRKCCKLSLTGIVTIDLRNEVALRALTATLLKEYFDLDVEFAPNSLIPTLTLRLNYILWIEDIINEINVQPVHGIDIGCGSSCIYALLAAKKNNWTMSALEASEINVKFAKENVERNGLMDQINIFLQENKDLVLEDFLKDTGDVNYTFCMCNPPFYDKNEELGARTRNPRKRKLPSNCPTGTEDELSCEGGEAAFVENIIKESQSFTGRIKVFTTMLGHKTSLKKILKSLEERSISNICTTEFCQGKTTRWGVAWSYDNNLALEKVTCDN